MHTREEISAKIEDYISTLVLPDQPEELYRPVAYALEGGGKRLRPLLLATVCDVYSQDDTSQALHAAVAVEVFHNFTLLHDDIMDNAQVRRGKSSVYNKWGRNIAILSGDAMVIYAYHLLAKCDARILPTIMPLFNQMALQVCEGQQYDMNFESREDVTLPQYEEMIRLKTAVIFAVAAQIGGIVGGAPERDCELLYSFGEQIGMAFQIQDDYLDTYGTAEVLGKAVGGDIAESKKTFLAINALNEAGAATRRALLATFKDNSLPLAHKISRVKTIYDSLDIPEITRGIISTHLDNASAILDRLSVGSDNTAPLKQLIIDLQDRNR